MSNVAIDGSRANNFTSECWHDFVFFRFGKCFFLPGPKLQEFAICNSFIWLGKTRYFGLFLHFVGKYWEFGSWVAPEFGLNLK